MRIETAVIKTKLMIPRRRSEVLSRPRLLTILSEIIEYKLMIVAAPAGYGKTSLLVDFSYHTELPICWFSLDPLDNDPLRFIAHFISAMQMRFPKFGKLALSALSDLTQDNLNYDPVIAAIVNDAYENITEHFVFILDDYHLIRDNKEIEPFINRIIQEMAENCHFIIASRVLLTLPDLSLLVARNQVAGLSFEELAFVPDEVKQLILANYHQVITEERASELVTQTEGWITGLLLSTELSPKGNEDRLRLAKVSGIGVYEYLTQQVFDRQPEDVRLFLLRTSLFEEFDAPLCARVIGKALELGRYPWHEKIEQILRDNLFVLSVGDQTVFLRYHHLFRDFLQNRMRLEHPEDTLKIERALALNYVEHHQWEQAYEIYNRLDDKQSLLKLIYEAGPSMITRGKLATLSEWFDNVPDVDLDLLPELLSIKSTISLVRGDFITSLSLLDRAIDGLRVKGKEADLVSTLNRRSIVYNHLGKYHDSLRDANEAISLTENIKGMEASRAESFRLRGMCLSNQGDLLSALDSFINSRNIFSTFGNREDIATVLMEMGLTQRRLGNFENAEKDYEEALRQWQSSGNSLWQSNVLNNLGFLQNLRGQYEQAALSFEKSLQYAKLAGYPRGEGFGLISLGDLYRDLRAFNEAAQAYDMARQIVEETHESAMEKYLLISQASLKRIEKKFDEANELMEIVGEKIQKDVSKFELDFWRTEKVTLLLAQNITEEVQIELADLETIYDRQGNLTETLKVKLLQAVYHFNKGNWINGELALKQVFESRIHDAAINLIIQVGSEFVSVFRSAAQHILGSEPVMAILEDVARNEEHFPEYRKNLKRQNSVIQFTSYQVSIRAFGKMQVKVGDHIISTSEWKSQTARDLMYYLLAHSTGSTKEEIGDIFWPDSTPEELRLRFKNTIYRLRRAAGNDVITYTDEIYQFNRSIDYDYDVEQFQREYALAQAAQDIDGQIKHYKASIAAYQGEFLPKVEGSWVFSQREQYQRQFIIGALKLANLLLQQGHYNSGIQYCKRILEQDVCNEAAYRLMMLIYAAMEDRAAIKRTYEACRLTLIKELNIEPGENTRNLLETLLN